MIRLAFLSDLHFGEGTLKAEEALLDDLLAADPSAVLVGGDLTRRARAREFAAAQRFLARLERPVLVVPGNHDIPRGDLWARFTSPRAAWAEAGLPVADGELVIGNWAILGLDTVRRIQRHLDWSAGGVSRAQLASLPARVAMVGERRRLVLCHHPLRHPAGLTGRQRPRRADTALEVLAQLGVEAVLSGHLHIAARIAGKPEQVLAPTALSPRTKGSHMGWLKLTLGDGPLGIEAHEATEEGWRVRTL
ncbi:metallophosphoesterase family protein [Sabulicella glaciei]|uniref:Metallophosphoesterase n=1 Tax=Sabulicella glaciei TaxID=2984948 RepID=A0ABT3NYL6_9PROT|nr:metallophosphoesterase [Roseococcus sp. MDT2-1-1]MCW8087223.1 metallophosphoesterase [Roseococcus sp. MDT2-1-1]